MLYRLFHRDNTEVVLCKQHLDEVIAAEEETIGKVNTEPDGAPCCMCEDQKS